MKIETVKRRLRDLEKESQQDDEGAHASQDQLYLDVLRAIAEGAADPQALAAQAIKADDIEFSRWYA